MFPIEQIKDKIINTVKNNQITILSSSTGTGKAMPLDTDILTPSGWVKLKDIHPGSIVYDENGEETKVINEFYQGEKEVYEITFIDDTKIECCEDHLWKFSTYTSYFKRWKVLPLHDIYYYYTTTDVQGTYQLAIPINKPIKFSKKDLPFDPLLAGIILNTDYMEYDNQVLFTSIINYKFFNIDMNEVYEVYKQRDTINWNDYLYSSVKDRLRMLQGLIAAYGDINDHHVLFIPLHNKDYSGIEFLINSLGYRYRIHDNCIYIHNANVNINNNNILILDIHKYTVPLSVEEHVLKIKKIRKTNIKKEMKCIRVASDNATFICQNFIVTHNSSYIPYLLYKELGLKSVVTQPRRLACASLTEYVRSLLPEDEKNIVGYKTGLETDFNEETNKILYVTDGILAVHGLTDLYQVFIIDEIHEWSLNIEVVLSYLKERLQKFKSHPERYFKVILMSATINVNQLKLFFLNFNPQTIQFNYMPYPIKVIENQSSVIAAINNYYQNNNILVFLPGKKEIDDLYDDVCHLENTKVFILHGDQTLDEQKPAFEHYKEKKLILSTNVCQTSITIDDIDVVIDTGLVKQIQVDDGIKGLYTVDISQSDCIQRKGRAGRTKPGTYILCSDISIKEREPDCIPEIKRIPLEDVVLRLLSMRLDIFKMNFIHTPPEENIKDAIKLLKKLELILDNTTVTPIGKEVTMIPLDLRYAIMLIESKKYGRKVFENVAKICAIMQAGGLLRYDKYRGRYSNFSSESSSDLIAELNIYNWINNRTNIDWKQKGINEKHYLKAQEYLNKILEFDYNMEDVNSVDINRDIKKCILVGHKDALYTYIDSSEIINDNLDFNSCTLDNRGCFVGTPRYIRHRLVVSAVTYIPEKLYTDVFGKDTIKYEMDAEKINEKINVYYIYAYAERNDTQGVFWYKEDEETESVDPEIITTLWNKEHKDDIVKMFSIYDLHFYVKENITDEIINLDNEELKNKYILLMPEDFEYYNLFKIFSEVDHSEYQFILNINTRLITLGRGYTLHDDEQLEQAFNRVDPIYIVSSSLEKIKERLVEEQEKQQVLVDNLKKRYISINNKRYRIECNYINNIPKDLTIKRKYR